MHACVAMDGDGTVPAVPMRRSFGETRSGGGGWVPRHDTTSFGKAMLLLRENYE